MLPWVFFLCHALNRRVAGPPLLKVVQTHNVWIICKRIKSIHRIFTAP